MKVEPFLACDFVLGQMSPDDGHALSVSLDVLRKSALLGILTDTVIQSFSAFPRPATEKMIRNT